MCDYEKLAYDLSDKNIAAAESENRRKDWHENRFNYVNTVIAVFALILSIISILMQL